jgi:predicted Zn finger-like uncharacterized protein
MNIVTQCPDCEQRLHVPDSALGRTVKCPKCGTAFRASEVAPPRRVTAAAPVGPGRRPRRDEDFEEESEERDRPHRRRRGGGS